MRSTCSNSKSARRAAAKFHPIWQLIDSSTKHFSVEVNQDETLISSARIWIRSGKADKTALRRASRNSRMPVYMSVTAPPPPAQKASGLVMSGMMPSSITMRQQNQITRLDQHRRRIPDGDPERVIGGDTKVGAVDGIFDKTPWRAKSEAACHDPIGSHAIKNFAQYIH